MSGLETYFDEFRKNVIGIDKNIHTPFGEKKLVYADWTASGRLYKPIEDKLVNEIGPFVANTHTESNATGTTMTRAYHRAQKIIKEHCNAAKSDVIITTNSGMTGVVNKFQRILGMKICEKLLPFAQIPDEERPVVFVTHMEHHSNQTSWLETIATVECISPNKDLEVDLEFLEQLLERYKDKKIKIAAVTGCSNVTGISTPYYAIAEKMHQYGGLCFVDFAASAPYVEIDMHPENPLHKLDAIYFSPHKFLGGPGTTGVLIFDSALYSNKVPDHPGGGTVSWTNPWGGHSYTEDIEAREDGGTPAFLQTIKAALCIQLKEEMGIENMLRREKEILGIIFARLEKMKGVHILAAETKERLGIFSFYIDGLHYNLGVKLLNDLFGIQTRGGCSCAGTYGHYLLNVTPDVSKMITDKINTGVNDLKPGWIRLSIHPVMTSKEIEFIMDSIEHVADNFQDYLDSYIYDPKTNEFNHISKSDPDTDRALSWFATKEIKEVVDIGE